MNQKKRPMTVSEAARRLGCAEATVRFFEQRGLLRAQRVGDAGMRIFDPDDVDRLAAERQRAKTSVA